MADVEMELDPSRSMAHDDHIDEDLIEYDLDTDLMDGHNSNEWAAEDLEIQDVVDEEHAEPDMDAHIQMDTLPDDAAEHPADAMDTLDVLPFSGTSGFDADMLSDMGADEQPAQDVHAEVEQQPAPIEDDIIETTVTDVGTSAPGDAQDENQAVALAEPEEQTEEIDFGTGPEEVAPEPAVTGYDDVLTQGDKTQEAEATAEAASTTAVEPKPKAAGDEDELTWEEDEVEVEAEDAVAPHKAGEDQQTTAAEGEPEESSQHQQHEQLEQHEQHEQDDQAEEAAQPTQVGTENLHEEPETEEYHEEKVVNEHTGGEAGEEGDVTQEEADKVTDQQHPPETNEEEQHASAGEPSRQETYPSITVQYKGDEFPCFAAVDGFFTNTSVLLESMETLLAGFRSELTAELAPDEELVFHVDELGLEFAESAQQDLLSGTTLQQLIDIHDMLLQNQDHDHDAGSKNLYTYLFTRSSMSKRLDFLSECAANGKGLDEVIHLFEPDMRHHDMEDTPAILDDQGDDYASPGDHQPDEEGVDYEEAEIMREETEHAAANASFVDDEAVVLADDSEVVGGVDATEETTLVPDMTELASNSVEVATDKVADKPETGDALEPTELDSYDASSEQPVTQVTDAPATATSTSSTVDGNEILPLSTTDDLDQGQNDEVTAKPLDEGDDELAEIDWREDGDEEEDTTLAGDQTTPVKRARADDEVGVNEENDAKRQRSS